LTGTATRRTTSFEELVLRQRACRRFDPAAEVPDRDIATILNDAVHAPSANNWQPWEFIIVRSPEVRSRFGALVRQHWLENGYKSMPGKVSESNFKSANDGHQGGFETAPVLVVVANDVRKVPEIWAPSSIYLACQNLLLGAASLGYGSCFTTGLTTLLEQHVREMLQLPHYLLPMAGIYIGRAASPLGKPSREPAEMHTHRETFGTPWQPS
jgi:nitroreductase